LQRDSAAALEKSYIDFNGLKRYTKQNFREEEKSWAVGGAILAAFFPAIDLAAPFHVLFSAFDGKLSWIMEDLQLCPWAELRFFICSKLIRRE